MIHKITFTPIYANADKTHVSLWEWTFPTDSITGAFTVCTPSAPPVSIDVTIDDNPTFTLHTTTDGEQPGTVQIFWQNIVSDPPAPKDGFVVTFTSEEKDK